MTFGNFLHLVIGIGIGYYFTPIALEWVRDLIKILRNE